MIYNNIKIMNLMKIKFNLFQVLKFIIINIYNQKIYHLNYFYKK